MEKIKIIEFPKIQDYRGNLSFIEGCNHIPFDIRRVFYIYDIPSGVDRGAHAHRSLHQVIICLSGSLNVNVDDGKERKSIRMNRPWKGIYIPPMVWASEGDFDPGTVYIVLASEEYRESDYIREYDEFLRIVNYV